jgi:hypothetical protein
MISAAQQGRNLAITVEGIDDPFVIAPLPGRQGQVLTDMYLRTMTRDLDATTMQEVMFIAIDGGNWDADGNLVSKPDAERPVWARMADTASLGEAQDVMHAAFFWQTVLSTDGVNTYIKAGGGMAGGVKALWALASTLGISPSTTSPNLALEMLIRLQEGTSPTSTPSGGKTLAKLPDSKKSHRKSTKKA